MTKKQFVQETTLQSGEIFLTTREFRNRFKIPEGTQCRNRANGDSPPFILHGGKILYPLQATLEWFAQKVVRSSAELAPDRWGHRYDHLPEARLKVESRKDKKGQT